MTNSIPLLKAKREALLIDRETAGDLKVTGVRQATQALITKELRTTRQLLIDRGEVG